jgi:transposase
MRRHVISDERWVKIKDSLPGKAGVPGRAAEDNRLFIEAVCWIARTGAPWRAVGNGTPQGCDGSQVG